MFHRGDHTHRPSPIVYQLDVQKEHYHGYKINDYNWDLWVCVSLIAQLVKMIAKLTIANPHHSYSFAGFLLHGVEGL